MSYGYDASCELSGVRAWSHKLQEKLTHPPVKEYMKSVLVRKY
jgi:hypothetical protein